MNPLTQLKTIVPVLVGLVAGAQGALGYGYPDISTNVTLQIRTVAMTVPGVPSPSLTIPNHFVDPAGLDHALVVGVAVQAAQYPQRIEVAYNTEGMTLNVSNSVSGMGIAMFTLVNPPSGLHDVVINFQDNDGNPITVNAAAAVAFSMSGVSQTSPVLNGNFLTGVDSSAALRLLTDGGSASVDVIATTPGIETTPGAGQTQNWTADLATLHAAGSAGENLPPGQVNMRHTLRPASTWIMGSISLEPAPVRPTP
jgi:hypothetical protein